MKSLQEYINESILEAKVVKAELSRDIEEWFKDQVYSNKKDFGADKKLKNYKDGGFGLIPGQFAKDRWGEGWFNIKFFDEKNPTKFVDIPEGVSKQFLELCSVVTISQGTLKNNKVQSYIKDMPNLEYVDIKGNQSPKIWMTKNGDSRFKTSWGETFDCLTMDEIEKLIFRPFKGYKLRGTIWVGDVHSVGPEIKKIQEDFAKLRDKYNVGDQLLIIGGITLTHGEAVKLYGKDY